LVLPLTGRGAEVGRALFDAAALALFEVGGERLVLLPRDSTGTAEGAAQATQAVLADGARLVLGPLFREEVEASAAIARAQGLPVIGFSSDRTVAGNDVFLLGFTPEAQVARVVRYALARGLRTFGALVPLNTYGDTTLAVLQRELGAGGGTLVAVESYQPDGSDADRAVRQLARSADAMEALFLPQGGAVLRQVAPLLPYYNIDPGKIRFIGTGLWEDATLGREPAMQGAWFAGPSPGGAEAFVARFERAFGHRPHRLAGLGYDAVALAALLVQGGEAAMADRAQLLNPSGFEGTDGLFRFLADGTAERGLAVIEIRPNGLQVIEPAPRKFEFAQQQR
jgi:ABC-type branched-subunit amino acid transport system substrate-binding protein